MGRELLLLTYQLNKIEITKKYCVNKNNPALKCQGKCHLKKQIQAQEEDNKKSDKTEIKNNEVLFASHSEESVALFDQYTLVFSSFVPYHTILVASYSSSIFRPPIV
jgi:hypothetical protein